MKSKTSVTDTTKPSEFSDPIKDIRDQVKQFDPYDLLSYVTLLGALPGNEIKGASPDHDYEKVGASNH